MTNNNSTPFRSYPQKYPKSQQSARRTASRLLQMMQNGPQSVAAVVVDTSYHVSQGYVTCTTNGVVVNVYSVPYGSVLPQMRIFIRQMGSHTTNRPYIFDGFAPNISSMGHTGSVMVSRTPLNPISTGVIQSASGAITAVTAITTGSAIGYYWHLYFFLPVLPTSTVTLMQMQEVGGSATNINLEYLVDGRLQFRSQDNHGLQTNASFPPHTLHWVLIQPGSTSAELVVDGVASYTGLATPTDEPTFAGSSSVYTLSYLSTITGANVAPIGSFVSKMGYGTSFSGSSVIPLIGSIPKSDSDIPLVNISSIQSALNTYLCEDTPGSTVLASSAGLTPPGPGPLSVNSAIGLIQQSGPY